MSVSRTYVLLIAVNSIPYSVALWTNFDYEWALPLSSWSKISMLHIVTCVAHLYMYGMNYIRKSKSYMCTDKILSPTQKHVVCTSKVE